MSVTVALADYYVYAVYRADGSICYVGKGRGRRLYAHLSKSHNIRLRRIISGEQVRVERVSWGLTNDEACNLEIRLIAAIGRADRKAGPLVNFTDGGEGTPGRPLSMETRRKIAARSGASRRGRKYGPLSDARKLAISVAKTGKRADPAAVLARARTLKGMKKSSEHRLAIGEASRRAWARRKADSGQQLQAYLQRNSEQLAPSAR